MTRNARFPAFLISVLICALPAWAQWRSGADIQEGARGNIVGTVADGDLTPLLDLPATVTVAAVSHWLIGLAWPVGFVLGAIVSPPDAVAPAPIGRGSTTTTLSPAAAHSIAHAAPTMPAPAIATS